MVKSPANSTVHAEQTPGGGIDPALAILKDWSTLTIKNKTDYR